METQNIRKTRRLVTKFKLNLKTKQKGNPNHKFFVSLLGSIRLFQQINLIKSHLPKRKERSKLTNSLTIKLFTSGKFIRFKVHSLQKGM